MAGEIAAVGKYLADGGPVAPDAEVRAGRGKQFLWYANDGFVRNLLFERWGNILREFPLAESEAIRTHSLENGCEAMGSEVA